MLEGKSVQHYTDNKLKMKMLISSYESASERSTNFLGYFRKTPLKISNKVHEYKIENIRLLLKTRKVI